MKLTKKGTPRKRAAGGGRKSKLPQDKILSKQIRVDLDTHKLLTNTAKSRGVHITRLIRDAVSQMTDNNLKE